MGFGLLFKRIYKLCGTASGKEHLYPSRIIDPVTGQHVPVAMSTAIYAASFIHMKTNGRLDYWSFFDGKHSLLMSVLKPVTGVGARQVRSFSDLDDILEVYIDEVWNHMATFGGAATQEKSKKIECWEYVRRNVVIPESIINKMQIFLVSDKEKEKRESNDVEKLDFGYFEFLNSLMDKNGRLLSALNEVAKVYREHKVISTTISNILKRIVERDKILQLNRVRDIYEFYEQLINQGFEFNDDYPDLNIHYIDVLSIYNNVVLKEEVFLSDFRKASLGKNKKEIKLISDIFKSYNENNAVSINDLVRLDEAMRDTYFVN
jgi:hypothetical protein